MSAGRTGLVSQNDLVELDVGKSVNRQQQMPVAQLMFGATTLYKPDVSDDMKSFPSRTRICFVFWKTDDQPDHIPKWEEPGIQAEVLRVWKFDKARELALKRADELKAKRRRTPASRSRNWLPARRRISRFSARRRSVP